MKTTEKTPSDKEWQAAERKAEPRKSACGYCGGKGHNVKTCPVYFASTGNL